MFSVIFSLDINAKSVCACLSFVSGDLDGKSPYLTVESIKILLNTLVAVSLNSGGGILLLYTPSLFSPLSLKMGYTFNHTHTHTHTNTHKHPPVMFSSSTPFPPPCLYSLICLSHSFCNIFVSRLSVELQVLQQSPLRKSLHLHLPPSTHPKEKSLWHSSAVE